MIKKKFAAIILAGGQSKRMKSISSKVLIKILGKALIERSIDNLVNINPTQIIIVANLQNVKEIKALVGKKAQIVIQNNPLGTLDAARIGFGIVNENINIVAVLYADVTAFYKTDTIAKVIQKHLASKSIVTFVTLDKEDPTSLGRIIRKNGQVTAIVEEKDATPAQKEIKEVNDGLYIFDKNWFLKSYTKIKPSQVTGELYLTDLVELALEQKQKIETLKLEDPNQWHGINTPQELAVAKAKYGKRIHIMGIAGSGASGVAAIARVNGYQVDGCDLEPDSAYMSNLAGIQVAKGHSPLHLNNIDILVISPAVKKFDSKNRELKEAETRSIPVLTWQEFQGKYLLAGKFTITISGSYGKSTTTAMIAQILTDAGLDPTCEIGATSLAWGKNFKVGRSKYYVCEADEYNNNFLHYKSDIAIILNIAWDHPDFFKNQKAVLSSFFNFVANIKNNGTLIISENDLAKLKDRIRKDIKIVTIKNYPNINLSIIGDFRKENANAALEVAEVMGLNTKKCLESLADFRGLARRLEFKGETNGVKVFDDYAVQPYTVFKTVNALKEKFKNQKVALIFEPHTFSRIETFFEDFVKSLKQSKADQIFITDVYPARESGDKKAIAQKLAKYIGPKAIYSGTIEKTAKKLKQKNFDVLCSTGAGNSYKFWDFYKKIKNG